MASVMRLTLLMLFVLIAFAGNSILTRLALTQTEIGPWSFSLIRFISGAAILLVLAKPKASWPAGRWTAAFALCTYGVFFSFAYLQLETGMGALLLFTSVQLTMLAAAFHRGERLSNLQWLGLGLALAGLIYLLSPRIETPSLIGAGLMIASGIGWGVYSILGKGVKLRMNDPVARTAGNFAKATIILLLATPLVFLVLPEAKPNPNSITLAMLSGTVTSGLGYALWYHVLRDITVTTAAISQLSVPVIAAIGGALLVFEPVTLPFALSCGTVLVGVGLATIKQAESA